MALRKWFMYPFLHVAVDLNMACHVLFVYVDVDIYTIHISQVKLAYCKEAVTPSDCRCMCKELLPKVREADGMMCKWRELIPDEKMSEAVVAGLNFADMQMAAYTLQVQIPGEDLKRYGSQAALAHDVVTILAGLSHTEISSPWLASAEPQSESKGDEQASKARPVLMRELNEDGSVKDCDVLLKELGFDVGVHVRRAADGEHGRIVSVEERRVRLQQASGVSRVSVDGFVSGEWASYVPKAEAHKLCQLEACEDSLSSSGQRLSIVSWTRSLSTPSSAEMA